MCVYHALFLSTHTYIMPYFPPIVSTYTSRPIRSRNILSDTEAFEIFFDMPRDNIRRVAALYRVSEKTIRDIWLGRTWFRVTGATPRSPRSKSAARRVHDPWIDPFKDDLARFHLFVAALVDINREFFVPSSEFFLRRQTAVALLI